MLERMFFRCHQMECMPIFWIFFLVNICFISIKKLESHWKRNMWQYKGYQQCKKYHVVISLKIRIERKAWNIYSSFWFRSLSSLIVQSKWKNLFFIFQNYESNSILYLYFIYHSKSKSTDASTITIIWWSQLRCKVTSNI